MQTSTPNLKEVQLLLLLLPDAYLSEVKALLLQLKESAAEESLALSLASQDSLAEMWDSPEEDEAWDNL